MAKKKQDPQDATVSKAQVALQTAPQEVAPDAETDAGLETSFPESEPIEGTRALPTRPADPRTATGGSTRPIAADDLLESQTSGGSPRSSEKKVPEDSTQAIPKRTDTGPLPPEPPPRPKTAAQKIEYGRPPAPIPAWVWALMGATGALVLTGAGVLVYQRMNAPAATATNQEVSASDSLASPEPPTEAEVPIALRSYMEKAKAGDDRAMVMLAVMYTQGLNVAKDEKEGRKWYERAAEKHNKSAEKWLKEKQEPGK